jgi:2-haloacid dehalogenase
MQKKTVVFDFGGVIFKSSASAFYRARFAEQGRPEADAEYFLTHVFTDRDRSLSNIGNASDIVAEKCAAHPAWAQDIRAYTDFFLETIAGIMPGMEKLLTDIVASGHRVVGLTNWHGDTYDRLSAAFPDVMGHFNAVVVSGKVGMRKPDPRIFQHAQDAFGNPAPDSVYYFDDKPANVEAAHDAAGWNAVVFTNAENARRVLALPPRGV